ncbi:hypothetical protein DACRYDRAFT_105074 [Dacryopinax primogenitus]|uniref:Dehydrin n=1 Tax=Dacryopinax primogenitus (strain DJM 731) TaxID=1858805 RepID=M5GFA9_DACPD|nr:uncharacterized protein DACRYDRAFT_105074 [Dacryopinax primogenitus]EJU04003.1 hypothetical protein DACRYDRAFT_105074 [Dacryopinax primogenitus]
MSSTHGAVLSPSVGREPDFAQLEGFDNTGNYGSSVTQGGDESFSGRRGGGGERTGVAGGYEGKFKGGGEFGDVTQDRQGGGLQGRTGTGAGGETAGWNPAEAVNGSHKQERWSSEEGHAQGYDMTDTGARAGERDPTAIGAGGDPSNTGDMGYSDGKAEGAAGHGQGKKVGLGEKIKHKIQEVKDKI